MFLVINDNKDNDNNDDDGDNDQLFFIVFKCKYSHTKTSLLYLIRMTMRYQVIFKFISFRLTT